VLLLDEPTNHLDADGVEWLQHWLERFSGALVLVTHDRYLLDRIANTVLALNGDGTAGLYAEYSQWEQDRAKPSVRKETAKPTAAPPAPPKKKTKLSYLDQREWDSIEDRIHAAEAELEAAHFSEIEAKQAAVDALYQRWAELEGKLNS
jgi:ATP-binding cassette subfamily F protein uup